MEKTIITTGKTIDAAVEAALAQLALTRDDITYQVLAMPKAGFLGIGASPARFPIPLPRWPCLPLPVPSPRQSPWWQRRKRLPSPLLLLLP